MKRTILILVVFAVLVGDARADRLSDKWGSGSETAFDVRVIDGDTINVPISKVAKMPKRIGVRFIGVNAPELHAPKCQAERDMAKASAAYVQDRITKATAIKIEFVRWDKYARVDGRIALDGVDLAQDLVKNGFAVPYDGGYRDPFFWCKTPLPAAIPAKKGTSK